jgi:hypothetical protein
LPSASGGIFPPGSAEGGGLEGFAGEALDSPDLPGGSPIGFGGVPECRFVLAEWWLFDPPVEEALGLESAGSFAFSPEWLFASSPE